MRSEELVEIWGCSRQAAMAQPDDFLAGSISFVVTTLYTARRTALASLTMRWVVRPTGPQEKRFLLLWDSEGIPLAAERREGETGCFLLVLPMPDPKPTVERMALALDMVRGY